MKFHESRTWWDVKKKQLPKGKDFLEAHLDQIEAFRKAGHNIEAAILANEARWHARRRPYYKVYPCVVDALCRLKLDCKYECPEVPEGTISIRFAEGHEPQTKGGLKIGSILASKIETQSRKTGESAHAVLVEADLLDPPEDLRAYWFVINPNPVRLSSMEEIIEEGDDPAKKELQALASRIALTVCMLADDPEIITPDVLKDDQGRYETASEEWKRKAEDKARRRGVFGWSVGKHIEVAPHVRRPHWAIRHTGPNRSVPKIVPVRGCKVKAKKLTEVPTGYTLPDGTEVEDGKPTPRALSVVR